MYMTEEIVKRFAYDFCAVKTDDDIIEVLKYEKDHHDSKGKILIASPSRFFGIADIKLCQEDDVFKQQYKEYTLKLNPKYNKDSHDDICFDGYYFSFRFLSDILNKFFKDSTSFKIKLMKSNGVVVLVIRINDNYAVVLGELQQPPYRIVDQGVYFIEEEYDEVKEEFVISNEKFVEWKDNVATVIIKLSNDASYERRLYHKNYLFEPMKSVGGLMMI